MDGKFGFPSKGIHRYVVKEHDDVIAVIDVDFAKRELVSVHNISDIWYKLPFGLNEKPDFDDFCYYMSTRIVSESYAGLDALYEKFAPETKDRYHLLLAMRGRVATDELEIAEEQYAEN